MKPKTEQFGVHFMLDGYGASPELLRDASALRMLLETIPATMGMHAISTPVVVEVGPKNRKDPGGLSGFVLIAESHVSFHTFPNRGFVTIDVYTCQDELDTQKLTKEFKDAFQFKDTESYFIKRGLNYPTENIFD